MIVKLIKLILGIKAGVNPQELLQWIKNRDPHFIERDFGSQQTELLLSKGSDFARYTLTTDSLQKKEVIYCSWHNRMKTTYTFIDGILQFIQHESGMKIKNSKTYNSGHSQLALGELRDLMSS